MSMISEYEDALERLINNQTINVPKGSKINNDTVALEAGRKRGSIKKSRDVCVDLILKIEEISSEKKFPKKKYEQKILKWKNKANEYRDLYEEVLNRELMLIERLRNLDIELEKNQSSKLLVANNI